MESVGSRGIDNDIYTQNFNKQPQKSILKKKDEQSLVDREPPVIVDSDDDEDEGQVLRYDTGVSQMTHNSQSSYKRPTPSKQEAPKPVVTSGSKPKSPISGSLTSSNVQQQKSAVSQPTTASSRGQPVSQNIAGRIQKKNKL